VNGYRGNGLFGEFFPTPQDLVDTVAGYLGASDSPEPFALVAREMANLAKYGAKNWYDWNIANWGTKWDVDDKDFGDFEEDGNSVRLGFDTAWSPPIEFYEGMERLGFEVVAYYYESGVGFCGKYEDGYENTIDIEGDSNWVEVNVPREIDEMFAISIEGDSNWVEVNVPREIDEMFAISSVSV
jgi:hypothetical protein